MNNNESWHDEMDEPNLLIEWNFESTAAEF